MSNLNSSRFQDLTGQVFGRLTVLERGPRTNAGATTWKCQCTCGVARPSVHAGNLKKGVTTSCGCYAVEQATAYSTKHGMRGLEEYGIWVGMWQRCTNPRNKHYPDYRSRRPPEIWRDFKVFYAELGPRPTPKHSLDRIKNDLPYGPGNCRWATATEQAQNTSRNIKVELDKAELCLAQACVQTGKDFMKVYRDWKKTGSMEQASEGRFALI